MYKHTRVDGRSHEERSGKLNEAFLLGDVTKGKNNARYLETLKKYHEQRGHDPRSAYLSYEASLELAREVQADNPKNPTRKFPHDLQHLITEEWHAVMKDGKWSIEVYSAVGTPLDVYHGVDAFVIIRGEDQRKWTITFDATINEKKIESADIKAHVLISDLPDPIDQERAYYDAVRAIAKKAVSECLSSTVRK